MGLDIEMLRAQAATCIPIWLDRGESLVCILSSRVERDRRLVCATVWYNWHHHHLTDHDLEFS